MNKIILSLLSLIGFGSIFLIGCASQPKTIIKYKYIEKPCPKLQTINLNEMNLTQDKPLKINFKIKEKGNKNEK